MGKLLFDGCFVCGEGILVLGVLGVLLDGGNGAAGGTLGADKVLEGDGEEVALIGGDLGTFGVEHLGEEVNHVFEALSLLRNSGQENVFFDVCHT